MSRQQLPRFLEQAARVVWLGPESRDFDQALIAPVDQCLSRNPFGGSRRAWRFDLRPGAFTNGRNIAGAIANLSGRRKPAGPVVKNRFAPVACVQAFGGKARQGARKSASIFRSSWRKFPVSRRARWSLCAAQVPPCLWPKPVADPEFGQQNPRPGRVDLDFLAQVADDDAQVMRVVQVRTTPNLLHDLLTRHDLAGVLRENLQDQVFLRAEDKSLAVEGPGAGD